MAVNLGPKRILMSVDPDKEIDPPSGLKVNGGYYKERGRLNPNVVQKDNSLTLQSRLIYEDNEGLNSCIVQNHAVFIGDDIVLVPGEKVVMMPKPVCASRGVEDFKSIQFEEENVWHGFAVCYNGRDARTTYIRSNCPDFRDFDEFGIFFPNIKLWDAINRVKNVKYKKRWKQCLEGLIKEDENPYKAFLQTKDCCLYPKRINGLYPIIIRLLPDMQIIYINGFKELASREFWQDTVENIDKYIFLERENDWEKSHIGLASSPIILGDETLIFYHGANMNPKRDYKIGGVLVETKNPQKILARTKDPLIEATESWEMNGVVDGKVVFLTGHAFHPKKRNLYLFYGAGDKHIAYTYEEKEGDIVKKIKEN